MSDSDDEFHSAEDMEAEMEANRKREAVLSYWAALKRRTTRCRPRVGLCRCKGTAQTTVGTTLSYFPFIFFSLKIVVSLFFSLCKLSLDSPL
jgi:hypothetical protein